MTTPVRLTRAALAVDTPAAPIRIVHLGLGHFFRAHQAWFTQNSKDAADWGIAAFTGRSTRIAQELTAQDGLFTLVTRGPVSDTVEVVASISEAVPGADLTRLVELLVRPEVAVVTLTITESGYRLLPDGQPDLTDRLLAADVEALRAASEPETVVGRLLHALDRRRQADAGPIAIVSCDNIPGNGSFVARGLTAIAALVDADLAEWIAANVSFVSTSVDRITPHITAEITAVGEAGWIDAAPVVTEPFADWVLQGDFPAGRPRWESAGARFVDDIEPWENRKLWLLNGAHTILTHAGLRRGFDTVAEAVSDDECRALVEAFWVEAIQCLPAGIEHEEYRRQLLARFANPRIEHRLAQIAAESTVKVQFRFVSVAERTLAAHRAPTGTATAIASWIDWVLSSPAAPDARSGEVAAAAASTDPVHALITLVSTALAADKGFLDRVHAARTTTRTIDPALA